MINQHAPILPLQQHPHFVAALRAAGRTCDAYVTPHGQVQMLRRRLGPFGTMTAATRGPIWRTTAPDIQHTELSEMARAGLRIINDEHTAPTALHAAGFRQIATPGHVALWDITGDMIKQAHGKWRNAYRQAQRAAQNVTIRRFDTTRDSWLLQADAAQQKQRRYRALPGWITLAYAQIAPRDVWVGFTGPAKSPDAAMLFLRHDTGATYHIGWTSDAGRATNAHHLIMITAATHLAERGVAQLDLGQVDTVTTPGLARFKLGTGARLHRLGGTWMYFGRLAARRAPC